MRAIILAAGQGFHLDGINKILLRDPRNGERLLDTYIRLFGERNVTVVVGYRAAAIMSEYPRLNYVYNADWRVTNNSYSLGLALDGKPCFALSSDLFFGEDVVEALRGGPENCVLTDRRDARILSALNCRVRDGLIEDIYQGDLKDQKDPEAIGIYKITDPEMLKRWKEKCLQHRNLFIGQNLPLGMGVPIHSLELKGKWFREVNTPEDYLRLLEARRGDHESR